MRRSVVKILSRHQASSTLRVFLKYGPNKGVINTTHAFRHPSAQPPHTRRTRAAHVVCVRLAQAWHKFRVEVVDREGPALAGTLVSCPNVRRRTSRPWP